MGFGPYRGGGGGMGNMQQLMKQAQKMQQDLQKAQEELKDLEVTGSAASGMVEVMMTCDGKLSGIHIKPEAVDPDDIETLQDMIMAAANEALKQVDDANNEAMSKATGGMNLGGLPF
jgi:DNA-binding YbaB/EbfC family protein